MSPGQGLGRRDFALLAAAFGAGIAPAARADVQASSGAALPSDPAAQNAARVRILGRTDDGQSIWSQASRIYAVLPDGTVPLLQSVGAARAWWRRVDETTYHMFPSTIGWWVDPDSGAPLEAFDNPVTGRRVALSPLINRRQDGEVFTPTGSYYPLSRQRFPEIYDDAPLALDWTLAGDTIRMMRVENFAPAIARAMYETATFFAPAAQALDPALAFAPAQRTGWFVSSRFSRWLDMDDVEGVMLWHFEGVKLSGLDDLDPDYLARARSLGDSFDRSPELDEGPDYIRRVQEAEGGD